MNKPPEVTVLMTVYNGERYLRQCMDSVLGQTFADFEFLIVDDCSTDESKDIIKSYRDNRIRLIENKKNLNQVSSLNIGLDYAAGDYIARIDQDDIMIKTRLEKQVDFLDRRRDVSLVGTWGEVIDENGTVFTKARLPVRNEEIVANVLFCGYFLMHPSVAFRKSAVMSAGKYDENIKFSEDYNLWSRLLLRKERLENIPEYLIKFRYHKKSSSRQFPKVQIDNLRISISDFIRTIIGENDGPELDSLCSILINAGLLNRGFWSEDVLGLDSDRQIDILERVLERTKGYFNFNGKEARLFETTFVNRLLNFIYDAPGRERKKTFPIYLFCFRRYRLLSLKPKVYLYPLKAIL